MKRLDGRVINVEKSCGGKSTDKRKEKLTALRYVQWKGNTVRC